ncbi:MAG: alkaline phosphatase family protein [Ilumatobacter sp.]|nr:alkaline phosphatase family protein [Ilumatobacter sp.]
MLRYVGETSATIWCETDRSCTVTILGRSTPTFSVHGHHYALVVVRDLEPCSVVDYEVELDGVTCWPPTDWPFPSSCIRTLGGDGPTRILFGSCRAAAPHEPPYSLEPGRDPRQRGVDAFRAHGVRMRDQAIDDWPDLMVFLGDQVYADDPSPGVRRLMRRRRRRGRETAPADIAANFEEYAALYCESWTPDVERWMFSVLPSTMIFDDHDVIDDWNISRRWVDEIRETPWWEQHIIAALVSYWIYQHAGNLSPDRLDDEAMLAELTAAGDGAPVLSEWARRSEEFTPVPGGYPFSYVRDLGDTRLIVIDSRNGRDLDPGRRRMVGVDEWEWICDQARGADGHLVLATSLPIFVPGGVHGLQQWNERLCDGAWGRGAARASEWLRRALDLEDWPAFGRSFTDVIDLLTELTSRERGCDSITVIAGDIHFSYVAEVDVRGDSTTRVHQVVSSPIRNALRLRERLVLRFAVSRVGRAIGSWLERRVDRDVRTARWELTDGPLFNNGMGQLTFDGPTADLELERASADSDGAATLSTTIAKRLTG